MTHKNRKKKVNRRNKVARIVGIQISVLQAVVSFALIVMLFILNMIPVRFIMILAAILFIIWGAIFISQWKSRRNGIGGKAVSLVLTAILAVGIFYIAKVNGVIGKISNSGYKIDNIVVAVLNTDGAQTLEDTVGYNFGVQYEIGGDDIREAVEKISAQTGSQIQTTEYGNLAGQAEALHNGSVQAIIYNEGYTGILEEAFEGYSQSVRIISTQVIKKKVEISDGDTPITAEAVEEPFSVYISGIDVYGAIETNSRSDVNIIATVNPNTNQILLSTTPRDFYVEIPGVTEGEKDKLTHAGIYGVDASMRALEQLYDVEIDFYVRVNFTSVVEIIDVLGGVDVNSEYAFTTHPDTGMEIEVVQGINHFNGEEALAFARERKRVPGGDIQRGKDQQAVITAIIEKLVSPSILINANGIIDSVGGNVDTNMSSEQIQALIRNQLNTGANWDIKSLAATGTPADMNCYSYKSRPLDVLLPDEQSVEEIKNGIDAVENGELLDGAKSTGQ